MPIHVHDIISQPHEWKSISRDEALRLCGVKTVVVIATGPGFNTATPFDRKNPYYNGAKPGITLKFYLKVGAGAAKSVPKSGGTNPKGPAQDAGGGDAEPVKEEPKKEEEKKPPAITLVKLDCPHFVPLTESVLIDYEITGSLDLVNSVHLRVAPEKSPDKFLLEKSLSLTPAAKGTIQWDGAVTDADMDGCLNLASSPYLVQLGLAPKGGAAAWTNKAKVAVELMATEIAIGDDSGGGVGEDLENSAVLPPLKDEVKKNGGKGKIHIPGNVFKIDSDEMSTNASAETYRIEVHSGIGIPLFVRLFLKGKEGGRKRSAKAVAKTPIIWDTLPEDEAALDANLGERGVHEAGKKYIKKVSAYKKDDTDPPGYSAHKDVGGMRAKKADMTFNESHWDALDVWTADALDKRPWAAKSLCAKSADTDADCGVTYSNGRIAGEKHTVAAYVDLENKLDAKDKKAPDALPAEAKTKPYVLQNWRDVRVSKSYRIGAGTAALDFEAPNKEYIKAGMAIIPLQGMVPEEISAKWKTEYKATVGRLAPGNKFIKDAALDDPDNWPARFKSYNDYWATTHPDAGFFGRLWNRVKAFFGAADEDSYIEKCDSNAYALYKGTAKNIPIGTNGLTVFKFGKKGECNISGSSVTVGIAPFIPGYSTRYKAVLFVFDSGQAVDTVIHEMGHNLFLAHGPGHWESGKNPAGFQADGHDKDQICLMSYHPDKKYFCGLCLLKLAGWDPMKLHKDGTVS